MRIGTLLLCILLIGAAAPRAEAGVPRRPAPFHHAGHADSTVKKKSPPSAHHPGKHDTGAMHDHMHMGHDMAGMEMGEHEEMTGMYGPYPMSREASGTSWQPEAAPHEGIHMMKDGWMLMLHGFANLTYDHQGGKRGDEKVISTNMMMGMASHPLGPGTLGLRAMLSAEPATVGKSGYPLLLQTGETGNGRTPLIDRQHPHDLFMELAGSFSIADATRSAFVYVGLPGEPALGPPAFMHRFSGVEFPDSPIGHHWLDSTHITYGVATLGLVDRNIKLEASRFHGREPDQNRYNIESGKLDSHSFRLGYNPTANWSFQGSFGRLHSPEQLEPQVNTDRTTLSAMYDRAWEGNHWQTTLAWGRNRNRPGRILDAVLLESALSIGGRHTLLGRVERVEKDELFEEGEPLAGHAFRVGKLSAGYIYDFMRGEHLAIGVGGIGSASFVPRALEGAYGKTPLSGLAFVRARIR